MTTYTVERIAGGTYSGAGVSPGGTTASLTTDGPNRLCVAVCFTERQLNGGPDYHAVASVAGGGVTWLKKINADFTYNDAVASGSFPNNYWHCDVFMGIAATQQTGASLTFTMAAAGDNFVNHGWAVVFTIDAATALDTDLSNLVVNASLSGGGASTITGGALTTASSNPLVLFAALSHKSGGGAGSHTIPSGYATAASISGNSHFQTSGSGAGGQADISTSFHEYATAQSGLVLTGSSEDYWWTVTIALAPVVISSELVTSAALEVLHSGSASAEIVTTVDLEVLSTGAASNELVTSVALEVLRDAADFVGTTSELVTAVDLEVLHSGPASSERVTAVDLEVLRSAASDISPAVDGTRFLEAAFNLQSATVFQEADWDSIWSIGDRVENGLISSDFFGFSVFPGSFPASHFNGNYAHPTGDGMSIGSNPVPAGSGWYFDFGAVGVMLGGLRLIGTESIDDSKQWLLRGGIAPGYNFPDPYPAEFDFFACSQLTASPLPGATSLLQTEFSFTPRLQIGWPYYEFISPYDQPIDEVRWCNELHLKVYHSILDGGDRRSSNGRPEKRTIFTMSSGLAYNSSGFLDPADALFDGEHQLDGSPGGGTTRRSQIGATGGAPISTAGAYLQFVFPREVIPQHILFETQNAETYTGSTPDTYGTWHWEFSPNAGVSWVPVGSAWTFREGCKFMTAPRSGAFNLSRDPSTGAGDGKTHWRMVLDSGPAFGFTKTLAQITFDLIDITGQAPPLSVAFSDDTDGTSPTAEIGPAGSPYSVAFTDNDSDALDPGTPINVPNPILSAAFSDGDSDALNAFADIFPSLVVQTIVVATGRK